MRIIKNKILSVKKIDFVKNIYKKKISLYKKNIILCYEFGCYFQKKNKFISDLIFNFPYYLYSIFGIRNLSFSKICELYGTDKSEAKYSDLYSRYFNPIKDKELNILEIGIGGHFSETRGGASLRALKRFFKKSKIFGIDLINKSLHERKRIKTYKGSQSDNKFLKKITKETKFDIVIDDGSHYVKHQISSFLTIFQNLKNEGIYIIEDTGSSYVDYLGGSSKLSSKNNLINFFSNKKVHYVNDSYILPNQIDKKNFLFYISSIMFYGNQLGGSCVIVEKTIKKIKNPNKIISYSVKKIKKMKLSHSILHKTKDGVNYPYAVR